MAYNTGNPVPSSDPRDLFDNSTNLDAGVNGTEFNWNDRLGKVRLSWAGIEKRSADAVSLFETNSAQAIAMFGESGAAAIVDFERDGAEAIERVIGFIYRGLWEPNTTYERKDVVRFGDLEYITMVDHMSSGSFEEDMGQGLWTLYTGISRAELASASGGTLVGLGDGNVQQAIQFITPEMYPTLSACFSSAMISGRTILFNQTTNIRIPTDAPTLSDALRYSAVINPKVRIYLIFQSGFRPSSGATIECGDYSNYFIQSVDSIVSFDPAAPTFGAFLTVYNGVGPTIDAMIDCNKRSSYGVELVWSGNIRVLPGRGIINAIGINLEARGSRADGTEAIFDGAGDVGVRVQQTSTVRLQQSRADNCGRAGFEASRASTMNVMLARAQNCGHSSAVSEINQGGLVVRRSLVAANELNANGSTRGLSCQLSSIIEGGQMSLEDCSLHGLRASTMSRVDAPNSTFQRSTVGAEIGSGCTVDMAGGKFQGCSTPWSRFGSGSHINVSLTEYTTGSRPTMARNTPTSNGIIYDSGAPNILESGGFRSASVSLATDTATSILIPGTGSRQFLVFIAGNSNIQYGCAWVRAGTSINIQRAFGTTGIDVLTGVLTGTTGVAGRITLGVTADRLYIENRSGAFDIGVAMVAPSYNVPL